MHAKLGVTVPVYMYTLEYCNTVELYRCWYTGTGTGRIRSSPMRRGDFYGPMLSTGLQATEEHVVLKVGDDIGKQLRDWLRGGDDIGLSVAFDAGVRHVDPFLQQHIGQPNPASQPSYLATQVIHRRSC